MEGFQKQFLPLFLITVFLFVIFSPLLYGKLILADGDSIGFYYPAFSFYKSQISEGRLPFWNPNMLGGFPLYADLVGGYFYPLSIFFYRLFDVLTAYNFLFVLNIVITAILFYFLSRRLGLSSLASAISVLTFVTSQWVLARGTIPPIYNTIFILPALFLAIELAVNKSPAWLFLGALALGIGLLAGHAQLILYAVTASFFWLIFILKSNKKSWRKGVLIFLAIVVLGFIIGSPQIISSYQLRAFSERSEPLSLSLSQESGIFVLDFLRIFFPTLQINFPIFSSAEPYLWIGPLAVLLLIVAFVYGRDNPYVSFLKWGLVLGIIASIYYSPLSIAFHFLPVFSWFRVPARWLFIVVFFGSLLAGFGFDFLKNGLTSRFKKILTKIFIGVMTLLLLLSASLTLFENKIFNFLSYIFKSFFYQPAEFPSGIEHSLQVLQFFVHSLKESFNSAQPVIAITFLLWIVSFIFVLYGQRLLQEKFRKGAVLLLLVISIFSVATIPIYAERNVLTSSSPVIDFLNSSLDKGLYRTFSLIPNETIWYEQVNRDLKRAEVIVLGKNILANNFGSFFGIPQLDGYSGVATERQRKFLAEFGAEWVVPVGLTAGKRFTADEKTALVTNKINMLGMVSVKYLVSPRPLEVPGIAFEKSFDVSVPIHIYSINNSYPKVYSPDSVICVTNKDDTLNLMKNIKLSSSRSAIVESKNCPANIGSKGAIVSDIKISAGAVSLESSSSHSSWLVIGESFMPGWHAFVDSQEAEIYPANYLFQAILIPAGEHKINFSFRGIGN